MKRLLSLLLLTALLTGTLPLLVSAEEGGSSEDNDQVVEGGNSNDDLDAQDDDSADDDDDDDSNDDSDDDDDDDSDHDKEVESDDEVEVDDDLSEDIDDAVEEAIEATFESEGDEDSDEGGDETVVSEEVEESDLTDEVEEDLEAITKSGDVPDAFYLSVQWGLFPAEVPAEGTSGTETDWSGSVSFEDDDAEVSLVARPYKLLRFEKDQDGVDFDNVTMTTTPFDSLVYVHNDGILFKVRTDLEDTTTKVVFTTAYQNTQLGVYTSDLLANGGAEFTMGDYKVVMKVWTREDWVEKNSEHKGSGRGEHVSEWVKPTDAEEGAWYESYMNYSVDEGFFQGYKDGEGQLTGRIGPGDSLTRFQLLKVLTRLSETLDMGVGALTCDEDTNVSNAETDWMGDHWARGYVQCALDSGYEVTLIDEIINENLETGEKATLRWEVLVTAAQLLGVPVPVREDSPSDDVEDSDLEDEEKDSIAYFYELGVVSGYPDGSFKPEKTVNRAEMFKIVVLLLESLGL